MLVIIDHPLIKTKLTTMRNKDTSHAEFRSNLNEIASLMVYEILRDYQTKSIDVTTPIDYQFHGETLDKEIFIVPILRAGLGMVEGILNLVPQARVGHIGIYRDEQDFSAKEYYYKIPNVSKDSYILVVDPMLATGVSASDAINKLVKEGFNNIKLVCLVGVQQGVKLIQSNFPNVDIYLASLDEKLNENNYIVPGLGDAGDRLFGTKGK
ncbi:uracil phosphoribosyltransferase [Metamycoplasma cloacale]|uniref:Uracil phosphoribosyltransferase n=1 Tax=Metamycoplasma cloacale TaxID=92401 RepID=A0A2Z4LM63_9BACT|nr:uracil phosphoribosyltransferase [Metamycoplasma cloacale]AWX42558.1 uracil phosphoribosyltransferase [Metamycoplasma cloacale]VEU79752.1 uracil phosphoribosyltransferase [Metamycoplasma cloacale]